MKEKRSDSPQSEAYQSSWCSISYCAPSQQGCQRRSAVRFVPPNKDHGVRELKNTTRITSNTMILDPHATCCRAEVVAGAVVSSSERHLMFFPARSHRHDDLASAGRPACLIAQDVQRRRTLVHRKFAAAKDLPSTTTNIFRQHARPVSSPHLQDPS